MKDSRLRPTRRIPNTSDFFILPAEVRAEIYPLVIPNYTRIRIQGLDLFATQSPGPNLWTEESFPHMDGKPATSLLCTNSRIYQEAIGLLYGTNEFVICHRLAAARFLQTIGEKNAAMIQELSLTTSPSRTQVEQQTADMILLAQSLTGARMITLNLQLVRPERDGGQWSPTDQTLIDVGRLPVLRGGIRQRHSVLKLIRPIYHHFDNGNQIILRWQGKHRENLLVEFRAERRQLTDEVVISSRSALRGNLTTC